VASPLVDATGEDAERAVGLVVVLVSEPYSGVVGFGALRAGETELAADDEVNDHLGADLRAPSHAGGEITLEHLVSHYGSLPNMPDNLTGPPMSPATDYSRAELGDCLDRTVLDSAPGSAYSYSNLGSGLLGVALADTTGEPGYDGLLRTHVTGPLGMADTGTNEPVLLGRIGDRLAQGYAERAGALFPVDLADMGVLAGGGEIISTGDDVALLLRALTGLDHFPTTGAVERALTPLGTGAAGTRIGYAFDILERPEGGLQFEKAGIASGYTAFITFLRRPAVGVAILSSRREHRAIQAAAREVLSALAELDEST